MLTTLAVDNYRSLRELRLPLASLTVVTGANGSGKSNLYRALRLLASAADGSLAQRLAAEGGIPSVQWAGPDDIRHQARSGRPIQGTHRRDGPVRVGFGFAADDLAYEISLGLPTPRQSMFALDPLIKSEAIWQMPPRRPANTWLTREGAQVRLRDRDGDWTALDFRAADSRSILGDLGEPERFPEAFALRERMRGWRFYDGFRTDADSVLRQPRVSVQTPVLADDGRDLAAAVQTILEIGDGEGLREAVADAFDGSLLAILADEGARLQVGLRTDGLLRPLIAMELSDGTLRYLCLLAALFSPRPPELLVLNEPEQSLHPDLLPALARQIAAAARRSQVWVVSHAPALVSALAEAGAACVGLHRDNGETRIVGQGLLDQPSWP